MTVLGARADALRCAELGGCALAAVRVAIESEEESLELSDEDEAG